MQTQRLYASDIARAAEWLREGRVIAFPTETVYGLGAPIFQPAAIADIFRLKGRPSDNPLIAHISDFSEVEQIAVDLPQVAGRLMERFFPGPLTLVLKKHPRVPAIASGGLESIALRMPQEPIAQKLISLVGCPLVAPSANLSGKPSATMAEHVLEDFSGQIAAVIDGGPTTHGIESTVLSLLGGTPILLRPGVITREEIEEVLGQSIEVAPAKVSGAALSPGMKYRHYAPKTPLRLLHSDVALRVYLEQTPFKHALILTPRPFTCAKGDGVIFTAMNLYALFRWADAEHFDEIVILLDDSIPMGAGLRNRVLRACETIVI